MVSPPGWDSLETVAKIHRFFEIGSIVCLVATAICGVFTYLYSHRKDQLVTLQTERERKQVELQRAEAQRLHQDQLTRLNSKVTEAERMGTQAYERALELDAERSPRVLSLEQRQMIIGAIERHPGHPVLVLELQDQESRNYANQIIDALRAAGWNVRVRNLGLFMTAPYGVVCILPNRDMPSPAAHALVAALASSKMSLSVPRRGSLVETLEVVLPQMSEKLEDVTLFVGLRPPAVRTP